ncbi:MAG: DUF1963 domain-containing protein [Pseudomonadota bacterium]
MFKDSDEARSQLADLLPADLLDLAIAALIPVVAIYPVDDPAPAALTRIGGTPVMAADIDWPRPEPVEDVAAFEPYGEEITAHIRAETPLAFIAQVDLAAVPEAADPAGDLPRDGRLLFFYDFYVGPFENGTRFARVIWDQSPPESAIQHPQPAEITAAAEAYAADIQRQFKAFNLDVTEDDLRSPFAVQLRVAASVPRLQALPYFSVEARSNQQLLDRLAESEADEDAFREIPYVETESDHPDFQLLGLPEPEQDDPRYDAAAIALLGKASISSEEWKQNRDAIFAGAHDWRLLAQIGFAEWLGTGEGTVYFLIRVEDLAAHRFDRVVAVYQQT